MSTVIVGCDRNTSKDHDWQNTVAKRLEEQGHTTEKLEIAPNPFAAYSYSSKASGKIGVYIIADGIFSIADLWGGNTSFKYAYFLIRGDLGRAKMSSKSDFENNPIGSDADCTGVCQKITGKPYPKINEITKDKCIAVWGGKTPEEGAKNLIAAMGGETTSSTKETSGSTIKDALKKAVSGWDGDVEIRLENDTVYVNRIPNPSETELTITEFDNALYDSITVTDVNPSTVNKLSAIYDGYELTISDDMMIQRFGENPQEVTIDPEIVKNMDDAEKFLQREFNKIRRDDGRSIECKVVGDAKWKTGNWVRVYLPSYFIDDYMYITKVSNDEDGGNDWTTGLTLVDYPPSFGTFAEETVENPEDGENTEEENAEETTGDETT